MNIQKTVREEVAKRVALRERLERDETLTPEEWVVAKEVDWIEVGTKYREERERRFLSLAEVAGTIGVSPSTLRRFESGQPVQRANMIERGYRNCFVIKEMDKRVWRLFWALDETIGVDKAERIFKGETYEQVNVSAVRADVMTLPDRTERHYDDALGILSLYLRVYDRTDEFRDFLEEADVFKADGSTVDNEVFDYLRKEVVEVAEGITTHPEQEAAETGSNVVSFAEARAARR
ncbi:helix-turn-helix domain-containing protein [Paenibacillus sp. CAU 1782]